MARPVGYGTPLGQSSDPRVRVSMTVNGERVERAVSPRMLLSDFIRHELRPDGGRTSAASTASVGAAR